jgi:hypothetical protein
MYHAAYVVLAEPLSLRRARFQLAALHGEVHLNPRVSSTCERCFCLHLRAFISRPYCGAQRAHIPPPSADTLAPVRSYCGTRSWHVPSAVGSDHIKPNAAFPLPPGSQTAASREEHAPHHSSHRPERPYRSANHMDTAAQTTWTRLWLCSTKSGPDIRSEPQVVSRYHG